MAKKNVTERQASAVRPSRLKTFLVTIETGVSENRQILFADRDGYMDAIRKQLELEKSGIEAMVFFHTQQAEALEWKEYGSGFNLVKIGAKSMVEVTHA